MPRWAWFLPLGALVVAGALYAYRLGWLAANLTEGDAILAYAARYIDLAGAGATQADCLAVPATEPRVWITVRCSHPDGGVWQFDVNRIGGLVRQTTPGDPLEPGLPRT